MELDLWTQSLKEAMAALWTKVAVFIPNLFVALILVLLGFVVAKLLDTLLSKLLGKVGLDRLMAGTGLTKLIGRAGIQVPVSALIGILLAQLVSGLVRSAADGVGLDYANGLARVAQGLVIILSISVAIGQLEVKTDLLNNVIAIVLISVGLAVALALGLGSRDIASQILAGIYVRELYEVGQQVQVGEVEGQIEEIGTVKTTLLTEAGELVSVANRTLLEQQVSSR